MAGRRLGFYGGSFDPFHLGHRAACEAALASGLIDELWVLPSWRSGYGKALTEASVRLHLCRLALADLPGSVVSDLEVRRQLDGKTWSLLAALTAEGILAQEPATLVVGEDTASLMPSWHRGEELIARITALVVPRPGYAVPPAAWYLKKPHRRLAVELPDISSTAVRAALQAEPSSARALLAPAVYAAITSPAAGYVRP